MWASQASESTSSLNGLSARYYRISRLLLALTQAKADGSYQKVLSQLARVRLLILDDWGLEALTPSHCHDLMELMDDRHGTTSTLIISQLPTDQWYSHLATTLWQTPSWTV